MSILYWAGLVALLMAGALAHIQIVCSIPAYCLDIPWDLCDQVVHVVHG